jgi:hypothetical protein
MIKMEIPANIVSKFLAHTSGNTFVASIPSLIYNQFLSSDLEADEHGNNPGGAENYGNQPAPNQMGWPK